MDETGDTVRRRGGVGEGPEAARCVSGRAMFVKISCRTGEPPVELSHHPELRFRFTPRAKERAPHRELGQLRGEKARAYVPSFHLRALSSGSYRMLS